MTLAEFKAWFEGFTEDMDDRPTEKQWKRIRARVKEIDGTVTSYPVFVDRYYPKWGWPYPYFSSAFQGVGSGTLSNLSVGQSAVSANTTGGVSADDLRAKVGEFLDAQFALYATGKADYAETKVA